MYIFVESQKEKSGILMNSIAVYKHSLRLEGLSIKLGLADDTFLSNLMVSGI